MRWRVNADEVMCDACGDLDLVHHQRLPAGWTETTERPAEATNHEARSGYGVWNLCRKCSPKPEPIPLFAKA